MERDYELFVSKIRRLTGIDLGQYKQHQMQRRLGSLLHRNGVSSYMDYCRLLERDKAALQSFVDHITINVSEFFRNPEKFDELQKRHMPELLDRPRELRIWSAGCANGAEPYSVAILLDESTPSRSHSILATDIDATILGKARLGTYTAADIKNVSSQRLSKYFVHDERSSTYVVKPRIRDRVVFRVHDLLSDKYPDGVDLILCRNVAIYFIEAAKDQLYRRFYDSLSEGGLLFVGGTEMVFGASSIGFESVSPFFYRKPAGR